MHLILYDFQQNNLRLDLVCGIGNKKIHFRAINPFFYIYQISKFTFLNK